MADPTLEEIEKVVVTKNLAIDKSEFVESIKCTAAAIAGDRYKITFSEASTEGGN